MSLVKPIFIAFLVQIFISCSERKPETITSSGLSYYKITEATGPEVSSNQIVHAQCILTIGDTIIWNTRQDNQPFEFKYKVDQMIPGFDEAISLMSKGDRYVFTVPAGLGYGSKGSGPTIPPNSTLIFDIEIIEALDSKPGISEFVIGLFIEKGVDEAIAEIKSLNELQPESYDFSEAQYVLLARQLRQEKNFEAYLAVLELTVEVHTNSADAFNRLARVYSDLGRSEEALKVLDMAVEINGGNSQTHLMQVEFQSPKN